MENLSKQGNQMINDSPGPDVLLEDLEQSDYPIGTLVNWGMSRTEASRMLTTKAERQANQIMEFVNLRLEESIPSLDGWIPEVIESIKIPISEIKDSTGLKSKEIRGAVESEGLTLVLGEDSYVLEIVAPEVNPKKVIDKITARWWEPGTAKVMRARTQWRKFGSRARSLSEEKSYLRLKRVTPMPDEIEEVDFNEQFLDDNLLQSFGVPQEKYGDFREVYSFLKKSGGRKFLTGESDILFERLAQIGRGEEVDMLMWNCLGFEMMSNGTGWPDTFITSNMDVSLIDFFKEQIAETMLEISRLGNPNFIVLVPTNEGLGDGLGIWNYLQDREERETLMDGIVEELERITNEVSILAGQIPLNVIRWDEYLQIAGVELDQNDITRQGIEQYSGYLEENPEELINIEQQALNTLRDYGISNSSDDETIKRIIERQRRFKGVYAGEGVVSEGNAIGERNILWMNLEGAGVKEDQLVGAGGNIAIVTPISQKDVQAYYKWKREVISARNQ